MGSVNNALMNTQNSALIEDVNYRLGSYLYWMISIWTRFEKENPQIDSETTAFMSALRYAYNSVKHDCILVEL